VQVAVVQVLEDHALRVFRPLFFIFAAAFVAPLVVARCVDANEIGQVTAPDRRVQANLVVELLLVEVTSGVGVLLLVSATGHHGRRRGYAAGLEFGQLPHA